MKKFFLVFILLTVGNLGRKQCVTQAVDYSLMQSAERIARCNSINGGLTIGYFA